jgi:hypothetical protein
MITFNWCSEIMINQFVFLKLKKIVDEDVNPTILLQSFLSYYPCCYVVDNKAIFD